MRLEGKVSLITGGARGIGAAIATLFAQEGSSVSIGDVLEAQGAKRVEGLRRLGRMATFRTLDVTKEEDWQAAVKAIINEFGRLDILVNNAGIGTRMGLEKVSQEEWERTMDVNAKGGYLGIKHCAPSMIQTGGGSIVNISSISAMIGGHTSMAYRASKGALRALTKAMALRYAPYQIRVNSIHPGDVVTPLNQEYLADPARLEERIRMVPLGRLGTPEDVAYLALYLASDQAGYVTGIEVIIDGGRTAG